MKVNITESTKLTIEAPAYQIREFIAAMGKETIQSALTTLSGAAAEIARELSKETRDTL